MANYVYLYLGGQRAETPEAQEEQMQAWSAWLSMLGDSVVEIGNPFGASATVSRDGTADGAVSRAGGYSVVAADSLEAAATNAKGCPILHTGGTVEVYEAIQM